MATYLYRLGKASFRHRRAVLAAWLLLLAVLGIGAATLSKPTSNNFTIPGVEAQRAIDLLGQKFPSVSASGAQALIVYQTPAGQTLNAADKTAITNSVAALSKLDGVRSAANPYQAGTIAADKTIALATVSYGVPASQLTDAQKKALQSAAAAAEQVGLKVAIGGDALQPTNGPGSTEVIGVVVGAVVLAITFGSMVAAGLPLLTAIIGVGVGLAGLTAVSHWVELSSTAPILALMLGLAVGIDYALFIISRYRHELLGDVDPEEAAGRATGTAGSAVVFAGLTVLIALAGLAVVGIPFLTVMGLAAAATVFFAVLLALTLLPALLGFSGRKIIGARIPGLRRPDYDDDAATAKVSIGRRWVGLVVRHRWGALVAPVLVLGLIAIPMTSMRTALPDNGSAAPASQQRQAYDLIAHGFGPGVNGPLTVVVTGTAANASSAAAALTKQIAGLPDVLNVSTATPNKAGDTVVFTAVPKSGPSSQQTKDLVKTIRALEPSGADNRVYVTGSTALQIDVSNKLAAALPVYLVVVVGLALLLLLIVFRSILVPLKATLGFLLTIGSTFGAMVAVYQWGWLSSVFGVNQPAPIVSFLPIIIIAILFGLAMDYEVFLVSRMREEHSHGVEPTEAVTNGFRHGARVVTAAAIIMTSVFAGFIFTNDQIIKSIGFALSFGVLVDAFIVRMTIVPAVMSLLGRSVWWLPRWLDRLVPNVDVEGQALQAQAAQATPDAVATEPELQPAGPAR